MVAMMVFKEESPRATTTLSGGGDGADGGGRQSWRTCFIANDQKMRPSKIMNSVGFGLGLLKPISIN